ncbi:MAG TPA: aminopeptidase N C-terminal domain-containing protein, partial [Myxococcota bacterium]
VRELAQRHRSALVAVFERCDSDAPYRVDRASIDRRRLANAVLRYLAALGDPDWTQRIARQFECADNMTQRQAALRLLVDLPGPERDAALSGFYEAWRTDPLMLDKWFHVQALSILPDTCDRVLALAQHPDFSFANPNRVRALVAAFAAGNQLRFHGADGRGYAFLADAVLVLDPLNPQLAARLTGSLNHWRRFDAGRRERMRAQLERIAARPGLSKDVYEITARALGR